MLSPTGTKWTKMTHSSQAANVEAQMSNLRTETGEEWRRTRKEHGKLLVQFSAQSLSK